MTKATITTIVDDHDVKQVNAWSACDGNDNRKVKGYFKAGDEVDIMETLGDYVEIRGIGYKWQDVELPGQKVRGWVHKAFLVYG